MNKKEEITLNLLNYINSKNEPILDSRLLSNELPNKPTHEVIFGILKSLQFSKFIKCVVKQHVIVTLNKLGKNVLGQNMTNEYKLYKFINENENVTRDVVEVNLF